MKVAILSDLHDNYANWQLINKILAQKNIKTIFFCGDLAAPSMLKKMIEEFKGQIYIVYGNVADRELEKEVAKNSERVKHFGDLARFDFDNRKICLTHYPDKARAMTQKGEFDLVCFGHNHLKTLEKLEKTLLVNPGTAGGMFQYPSFAIWDSATNQISFEELKL